jgi:hypothetical protein
LRDHWPIGELALVDAVDIKGLQHGYVILPPSELKGRGRYMFEVECSPLEQEIARCPEWLEAEILASATKRQRKAQHEAPVSPASFYFGRLFMDLGMLGPELRFGVWAVECPNADQHSGKRRRPVSGDTVICAPPPGSRSDRGWFFCAHAHCSELQARLLP